MKPLARAVTSLVLLFAFLSNTLPCGPGYITPLFDTSAAPENPYSDFASGRLGIIKPTFRRSVLYAAYRYLNGGGLNAAEQQAVIEVWRADLDNKDFVDNSVDLAVKAWLEKRKLVADKEEAPPDIYAERAYGGYEFFPNCTRNAFETASETLADRVSAHGPSDPNVVDWLRAQDSVFGNCSSGKQSPEAAPPGAPEWLQKDREYQMAAASFYALDYEDAKRRFAVIADDLASVWAETADYLVGRTLVRQASLTKDKARAGQFYDEAERRLERFVSRTGKFSDSAERMLGLIKYRQHPKERVSELAKKLAGAGGDNFRQDLVDYSWLLDKFASEILTAEERRKSEEKARSLPPCAPRVTENCRPTPEPSPVKTPNKHEGELQINLYLNEKSYTIYLRPEATDDDAIAEAERVVGQPLNDQQKEQVRSNRRDAYASRFKEGRESDYEGGYWGEEKLTPSLMPDFLKQDDLTDWLYTYQMQGADAYAHSLNRYKATGSDAWLVAALSNADKTSADLGRLLDAANNANRLSPGYLTIAYHTARVLLSIGRAAEARKLLDDMLAVDDMPISAKNSFMAMRRGLTETLDDYLRFSLKRAYGFDFDGDVGTIDEFIAEQKKWYNPESFPDQTREQYEAEVENNYREERLWQQRLMFDEDTIEAFNRLFPQSVLGQVQRSPALPEYLHERFLVALWTRAWLLDDMATVLNLSPELIKYRPEFNPLLSNIASAPTQAGKDAAALYFVLKNPVLSPYLESGMGKTNNEQDVWSSDDWWCGPYDTVYDDATSSEQPKPLPPRPAFLTPAQVRIAQSERTRLKDIGDAPMFLGTKVLDWAKRAPADKRVPEALYIMIEANGWTKYGCGNNEDLRNEMSNLLKTRYPNSEWTAKLRELESGE